MKTRLGVAGIAAMLVLAACGGNDETSDGSSDGDSAEKVTLKIAYNVPEGTITGIEIDALVKRVAERTDGNLVLETFPASQLGAVQDTLQQATSGANIISNGEPSILSTLGATDMSILTAPFLLDDPDQWRHLTDSDLVQGWMEDIREESGLRILDLGWYVGKRHIIGKDAYPTPEDLKGVKIRIPPLPAWETLFKELDSAAVTVDFAEVYTGLQQGVVDAAEAPLSTLYASKLHEVADQVTLTGHFIQFQGFAMSDDVFSDLPEDYQTVLLEEFRTGGDNATQAEIDSESTTRTSMESEGVTFTDADVEAYRKASAGFYTSYPDWSDGLEDEVRAVIAGG